MAKGDFKYSIQTGVGGSCSTAMLVYSART